MIELIIESDPLGAEVQMDGETIGTTPLTIPIDEITIDEFRAECLASGEVVCDWYTLKTRLEDQTVSHLWWDLTESERRTIAETAVKNTLFYKILELRGGASDCGGGSGSWTEGTCMQNAIIRYMKFSVPLPGVDACYWKNNIGEEMCYVQAYPYNLPCNNVVCVSGSYGHVVCGIKVVNNLSLLSNWVLFQYGKCDIQPGDGQLPRNNNVNIYQSYLFRCHGTDEYDIIKTFKI